MTATDEDKETAIDAARRDHLADKLTLPEFEREVEGILRGESDYLPMFELPR